jgi:mannose-6-phosphate isomerase-like protein (cupin superfamily)
MVSLIEGMQKLIGNAELYLDLIGLDEDRLNVEINLTDTQESVTLIVKQNLSIIKGIHKPDYKLTMTSINFNKILNKEADFGALIGRSKMTDIRPINIEILNHEKTETIMSNLYSLMTVFFTPGKIKTKVLHEKYAGEAHGAHPIPLLYWNGVRCAWYLLKKGETANVAGEKDPYPQLFIPLKGEGMITIGESTFEVELNRAVYIPSNVIHQITAKKDMEGIWLAWKTP